MTHDMVYVFIVITCSVSQKTNQAREEGFVMLLRLHTFENLGPVVTVIKYETDLMISVRRT